MNEFAIIPKPVSIEFNHGTIDIAALETIYLKNNLDDERRVAKIFQCFLQPIISQKISRAESKSNQIVIAIDQTIDLPNEGYQLVLDGDNYIKLTSKMISGLFYGFQTFRQLCPIIIESKQAPDKTQIQK